MPFNVNLLFTVALAVLGLLIGSFLNVVIARLPAGASIVRPRSRCPNCQHELPWYENLPLLSWLFLRGQCSACGAPISWRYPLVELITSLLFLACLRRFDWTWELASGLMLVTLLVPLTFIDLEHWLLPFALTLPGIALGLGFAVPLGWQRLSESALGAATGFFGFWAVEWFGRKLFRKEALGGGDKYLLAMLGAFLGYKALLGVVFLASLQGAMVGLVLLFLLGRAGPAPAGKPKTSAALEPELIPAGESKVPFVPERGSGLIEPRDLAPANAPASMPTVGQSEEDDWQPGPTNIPFGPWLSLAALEMLLLQAWLAEAIPWRAVKLLMGS